jgi:uncharacterized protein YqiB (DUF1249 family)
MSIGIRAPSARQRLTLPCTVHARLRLESLFIPICSVCNYSMTPASSTAQIRTLMSPSERLVHLSSAKAAAEASVYVLQIINGTRYASLTDVTYERSAHPATGASTGRLVKLALATSVDYHERICSKSTPPWQRIMRFDAVQAREQLHYGDDRDVQ